MKYIVRVEHEVIEYTELEIEANSEAEALNIARTKPELQNEVEWTLDDYIGDYDCTILDI